ncbi:MAG: 2Fe-2S iron-sulfur cluster-binding protein [Candidatus Hydrogenedentes bacterium]|nr:2Fe-2S iron-sulfur cluster-binding protein [Candidatus Hydrogenedentota bacterium]
MGEIVFEGEILHLPLGATVLDALEAAGKDVRSSCRSGICQTCMMQALEGSPPAKAQAGLRDTLRVQRYFLACMCIPEERLVIGRPGAGFRCVATIAKLQLLNDSVSEVRLRCADTFDYRPGQFVNLVNPDGIVRSYSLASIPGVDDTLALHVARVPGGAMSGWVHERAKPGDSVELLGPHGNCFYVPGNTTQPLLLVGTGTGLAPLLGILTDALRQGHDGPIHLFHGSVRKAGLYLVDRLRALAERAPQFHYHPCVLEGDVDAGMHLGPIDAHVPEILLALKGFRVYLCGHPDLVKKLQKQTFLMGASLKEIFADPFVPAKPVEHEKVLMPFPLNS